MRLRQLVLACGLTSLVLSPYASALGLGEVKLKSTLNQPLEAEIKLLDTRDLTAEQILVALASPADFERNGVDRLFFYTEFQFQVDLQGAGGPKVLITSRNPVREPYLNFLIEARWTAGRLLREYTLLMDLPTFDEGGSTKAAPVAATSKPTQQPKTSAKAAAPVRSDSSVAEPRQASVSRKASLNGNEYEVRGNDTLWDIAQSVRPDSSVSVHQSMMALFRTNPDAFINGDINRLRRGQVLRVPDAAEMGSVGKSEAVAQFAQAIGETDQGAQLNASRRTTAARAESAEVSGRVKLAAPSSGTNSTGQGSGANDGAGKALEAELAGTLEELDKSKAENTELSSRVKDLESQIQTMERLVAVSNEKLRALQVASGQADANAAASLSASTTAVSSVPSAITPADPASEVAAVPAPASSAAAASSIAAAPAVDPKPATPPKKVAPTPVPESGLVDTARENAPWIGLGVLGLVGAGYFAYRRRKQAEEEQAEESSEVFALDDATNHYDEPVDETNHYNEVADEASLFDEQKETTTVAETGDVVGEADIYIAYGKLDQAEEMLVNALQKDPDSAEIRMKLLEVYAQQQNAPAFDRHYAALMPLAGGALLARASELRESISGAGEFDPVVAPVVNRAEPENDQFSLDDFGVDDDLTPPATTEVAEAGGFDFNFDLDEDEAHLDSRTGAEAASESGSEFELDFGDDLELASEPEDLSELSLALDDLDADSRPTDLEATAPSIEEEFSFDLDDDIDLGDSTLEEEHEVTLAEPETLDVSADDFNLDMNVDDVDLAALDHEMESLDADFDEDLLAGGVTESEFDLNLDDDLENDFDDDINDGILERDLSTSELTLTDDLDGGAEASGFALDEELADFNDEVSLDDELDLAALDEGFDGLDKVSEAESENSIIDVELKDETPAPSLNVAAEKLADADDDHDDLFAEAMSDFSGPADDLDLNEFSSDEAALADLSDDDMDAELDFLADADEAATKLDLARAYIDMGDSEGAKDILSEVLGEGNDEQRKEANDLLARIG
ncbi:MAG TPA: FimV/HubP family polar landmark protein [Cellvibrio sp.]|nr:FimV/HubP family polar landmark protein [Cellvibrio sp.]